MSHTEAKSFWRHLEQVTDPAAYRPARNPHVTAARLQAREEPYYILKEPLTKSYLRLSEEDFALWWQMDGRKSIKDLLFYSLLRYRTLPIGHLTRLVTDLRQGHFLLDTPTNLYRQVSQALAERQPASRGRRLLDGFLHTEISISGLDDFFTPLYRTVSWIFHPVMQLLWLLVILVGGVLFGFLFWQEAFALTQSGGWSVLSLLLANLLVLTIHEFGHALATKHYGRELDKAGFLIYWGLPAFFVDTRDIWLSPRRARIAVSWAGPHSGLIVGGGVGLALTAVILSTPAAITSFWVIFLYQVGFIAYLSVFFNLNPLLELDGYFILMDWLEMPGLRRRALDFWRRPLWQKLRQEKEPRTFWRNLSRAQRVFTFYGGLALIYSVYAVWFSFYFWRTRLLPLVESLWRDYGVGGQVLLLLVTAVLIIPAVYYLFHYGWNRVRAGLEWLARRDLLGRPDVLALLLGLPLLAGVPLLLLGVATLPRANLWLNLSVWLLHLGAVAVLVGLARQLPGSRFQWAIWALVTVPVGLTAAWFVAALGLPSLWRDLCLLAATAGALAAGVVAWFTVWPRYLTVSDRLMMGGMLALGGVTAALLWGLGHSLSWLTGLLLSQLFGALALMAPLWLNFWRSRFTLPWFLLILALLALPWLQFYPQLHLPVLLLWLYAGSLYWLLGALAEFGRHAVETPETAVFHERERLVNSFNHFMQSMFASYETVFGGRRLASIRSQILALGPLDSDASILQTAEKARTALLLAVDRLDDLAGTPFTRQAGQAAYDSLPWLEAETLARHVLSTLPWGASLAQGFIQARDRRAELIRQADIFAGFDQEAIDAVLTVAYQERQRKGALLARVGADAGRFCLLDAGTVGVFDREEKVAVLEPGGYFGVNALLASGAYQYTYRALTPVTLLVIERERFDPLLRADTTLAQQVNAGAEERSLLQQMPLFSGLSPQQLAAVDARLQNRIVPGGEVVVREGQARSHLYIIAAGEIEVRQRRDDEERVVGRLGTGEHFGEFALFADTPYSATYRAVRDTELLLLDEPTFDRLTADCERMSHYVSQLGSARLMVTRRRAGVTAVLS